ncbi:MAG: PD-(D/E)XK nuclease family protein [Halofilum sp. (in: g-proteobacteria)]|nr:PD-(D/E)XK nuclease family protein [Halofilum sp. (in: g-proteobacteria)]
MYLPHHETLTRQAAEWAAERFADSLPDLTRLTVLVPTAALLRPLREALQAAAAARGHGALLGPALVPLAHWPARRLGDAPPPLSREACELLVHEALATSASHLARDDSRWQLAESLLGLFDELGRADRSLAQDLDGFRTRLREAYGTPARLDGPLSREAEIVHTLWQAWRRQLDGQGERDPAGADAERWRRAIAELGPDEYLLLLQPETPGPAVAGLLRALLAADRAAVLLRGNGGFASARPLAGLTESLGLPAPPAPAGDDAWIDAALDGDPAAAPLADRAAAHAGASPVAGRWRHAAAVSAEDEARAVALAAVEHLAAHPGERVVIATENRRLARRVRALLERFDLWLSDQGGWATSTTRAAAVVERWLECIEQDFDHRPLLDVLQSPFLREAGWFGGDRDRFDSAVHHFERDLVRHENVPRTIAAYRAALRSRSRRLGRWSRAQRADVEVLLRTLDRAAGPLRRRADGRAARPAAHVEALARSLQALGLDTTLAADAAGQRVLAVLARLQAAAASAHGRLQWRDFRTWAGRALEQEPFTPPSADTRVALVDLARAADTPADCLLLAGLDAEHLPGSPGGAPFFNDGVRAELGLGTWDDRWRRGLYRFRRALGSGREVVFTHARERDGEPVAPSPWLEALLSFHRLAFGDSLADPDLVARTRAFDCAHRAPLPAPTARPAPAAAAERLPPRLSVSRHGDLVACPYRFFAGSVLGLEPLEEVREELAKSDYGERLHRALEAFWQPVAGLPGPWSGPLDAGRREQAVAHLQRLVDAAFADDVANRFAHRAWHRRASSLVPELIDWAIAHARAHAFERGEAQVERALEPGPVLRGRLDRIDRRHEGGRAITDYKTGAVASRADMEAGEDVQLAGYALLLDDVRSVAYLRIERGDCREIALAGDELAQLAARVEQRLLRVWQQLAAGAPLPAWSNRLCRWCRYEGLCRRPLWAEATVTVDD